MQLTMGTVAEHVVVHEELHAGVDEPAAAGELCTERRKMHVSPDVN